MESYLKGKDFDQPHKDAGFSSYLASSTVEIEGGKNIELSPEPEHSKEVIYEVEGSPIVEVISQDGKPIRLLVHFDQEKVLEIDCIY